MNDELRELWVYLAAKPLTALALTLAAYVAAYAVYERARFHSLANPVLLAVAAISAVLLAAGIPYRSYFEGAQFIHFLLGPATVALAIPIHRELRAMRAHAVRLSALLIVGSVVAVALSVAAGRLLGASTALLASLAPKSVTAPVAMGITEKLGGYASLTAVVTLLTGITGATLGPLVLNWARVTDMRARGFAMGLASHGIGTARAMQVDREAGAYAGLAMGLNAVATALYLPWLWRWLH